MGWRMGGWALSEGWVDGWMGGWVDGWMGGRMGGWVGGGMGGWVGGGVGGWEDKGDVWAFFININDIYNICF